MKAKDYDLWLDGLPAVVSQQILSLWQVKNDAQGAGFATAASAWQHQAGLLLEEQHHAGSTCC